MSFSESVKVFILWMDFHILFCVFIYDNVIKSQGLNICSYLKNIMDKNPVVLQFCLFFPPNYLLMTFFSTIFQSITFYLYKKLLETWSYCLLLAAQKEKEKKVKVFLLPPLHS